MSVLPQDAWTRAGEGRQLLTYFPWAPAMCRQGELSCASTGDACASREGPMAPAALAQGCSPFPMLGQLWGIARCPPHPGLAGTTRGWLCSLQTLSMISINSCSTSRSQCSRPKHRIWAGPCSKRDCEQCYPSCRGFALAAWLPIWVAFEEPDLCLMNQAFFFI